jgi:RHS repeat-associated protein
MVNYEGPTETQRYRKDSKKNKENPFLDENPMSSVCCLMSVFSDYMHFRYYASTMGRFLKPDSLIPNPANPQSWNLYSYVNGNPVNFNDPSGHFAGGFGGGITQFSMKRERLGPPGGTIWDMAMNSTYTESIGGWYVSYSDWSVTGGDSNVSGQGVEQVDPLSSIPDASTLPEDQRNAYVLYGTGTPKEMEEKVIPFPATAAGEATDYLINKGYTVKTVPVTSSEQIKNLSSSGLFKNSIVVIAAHYFPNFYWNQALSTSGRSVAKWLGMSGASQVIYLSCQSAGVAAQTAKVGGMQTWGAKGLLNIRFASAMPPAHISKDLLLSLFVIDYWFITHK